MVGIPAAARIAGVAVSGLGATALGSVAGLAAERRVIARVQRGFDPFSDEPFGERRGSPYVHETEDGVQLHVEVDEVTRPTSAPPLTVIFVHGYSLNLDSWHFQRRDLGGGHRLVFYDHRSHGRSGRAQDGRVGIDQLARDLGSLIDAVAPDGPVVLVGHSMGGMTVLTLATQRPELFGSRVRGVGLIATTADGLRESVLGLRGAPARMMHRLAPGAVGVASRQADLIETTRRAGSDLGYVLTRRYSFGSADVSPSLVSFVVAMNAATPVTVVAEFLPTFGSYVGTEGLASLNDVAALVVGAGRDRMIPVEHSRSMAERMAGAEYLEIPDSGHMAMLEHHGLVTAHLRALMKRATGDQRSDETAVPVPLATRRPRRPSRSGSPSHRPGGLSG